MKSPISKNQTRDAIVFLTDSMNVLSPELSQTVFVLRLAFSNSEIWVEVVVMSNGQLYVEKSFNICHALPIDCNSTV
jgi:hypothetical protein